MRPTLEDDDIVMIDTSKIDASHDGLFVLKVGGKSLLVKRITRADRRGYVQIKSDNTSMYPTFERRVGQIEVVGKVVWMGVKV